MAKALINQNHVSKAEKMQQDFYKLFEGRTSDVFRKTEYKYLKQKIAFSLFGLPKLYEELITMDSVSSYTAPQQDNINRVYQAIVKNGVSIYGSELIFLSIIYVVCEDLHDEDNVTPYPVFCIQKCFNPFDSSLSGRTDLIDVRKFYFTGFFSKYECKQYCQIFIDHEARVYKSWINYEKNNLLPKCKMIVPNNGKYCFDKLTGKVILSTKLSPACSTLKNVVNGTDRIASIFGWGSAALLLSTTVLPAAAVMAVGFSAIGAAAYSTVRSLTKLVDRYQHQESIGLNNTAARGEWINTFFGIGTVVTFGGPALVSKVFRKPGPVEMKSKK